MAKIGYKRQAMDLNLKDKDDNDYINDERFRYVILERVDEIRFEKFGQTTDYASWDKGRLFGEEAEFKWHKRNGAFHLVVITDEDSLPAGFCEFKSNNLNIIKHREIFLWGEKDRDIDSWFEPRIPHLLKYPGVDFSEKKKRVKIVLHEYQFEETLPESEEQLTSTVYRFVGLIQDIEEEEN